VSWKLRPPVFRGHSGIDFPIRHRQTYGRFLHVHYGIRKRLSNVDLLRRQQLLHSFQIGYRHFLRNYWSLD